MKKNQIITLTIIYFFFITIPTALSQNLEYEFKNQTNIINIINIDYENNSIDSGYAKLEYESNINYTYTTSENASTGKYSLKTSVGSTDEFVSYGSPRAESSTIRINETLYSEGEKWEYAFSILIPNSWKVDNDRAAEIVWQFKRFNSPPDGFLAIKGESLVFRYIDKQVILYKNIKKSTWINIIFFIKWSKETIGETIIKYRYKNESYNYLKINDANLRNSKPKSGYVKWGLYRPDCSQVKNNPCSKFLAEDRIIYHDDINIKKIIN